jgi:hypothetical protein
LGPLLLVCLQRHLQLLLLLLLLLQGGQYLEQLLFVQLL